MAFPDRLRLPLSLDPDRLTADLEALTGMEWIRHFVSQNYDGDWSVLPLRGAMGADHPVKMIYPDPSARGYQDGPAMAQVPYIRQALADFDCPLQCVRLMRLTPGSIIKPHRDHDLEFERGAVRIHIPITTNPDVEFLLNGTPVMMEPGSAWYLRLSDTHSAANRGSRDRVHLVIDAEANDWLGNLLRQALNMSS